MFLNHKCIIVAVILGLSVSAFASPDMNQPAKAAIAETDIAKAPAPANKTNINQASLKELMKVKGINRAKARSIISYRKKHDHFNSLDDLKEVKGFNKMKEGELKAIEAQLTAD